MNEVGEGRGVKRARRSTRSGQRDRGVNKSVGE